ncbi:MAG: lysophospholipid acyltransferase family protein [Pirellulales bacterium]
MIRVSGKVYLDLRWSGTEHVPTSGPLLIMANHQSNWDPPLIGGVCEQRRFNYLAKKSLFKFPPLAWLIRSLDAIPIDRDGMGIEGVKETLRRLKRDEAVLVFPEGQRSNTGELEAFMPGFLAFLRRTKAEIVPVGIDGMFESWPRTRPLPQPGRVYIQFGEVMSCAVIDALSDDELTAEVERRIRVCFEQARTMLGKHAAAH